MTRTGLAGTDLTRTSLARTNEATDGDGGFRHPHPHPPPSTEWCRHLPGARDERDLIEEHSSACSLEIAAGNLADLSLHLQLRDVSPVS
ncbi:hypothetical protein AAFF_G00225870 [Aldrovandia affinis]|uniref:Uncharacterized protein n=1 Tax=Aldrovandia affinis TaxID=143900 RepID=A0AAD7TB62_9TELE|nr:hypothetical protein AAFF_G00225870 [Aldrovandia affinis]